MKHSFPLCLNPEQHTRFWGHIPFPKNRWIIAAMEEKYQREKNAEKERLESLLSRSPTEGIPPKEEEKYEL